MTELSSILNPPYIENLISKWLKEDVSSFDFGAYIFGNDETTAEIFVKQKGILAGIPFADAVFRQTNCKVTWLAQEGEHIEEVPFKIASITGPTKCLLRSELLVLNTLIRASGIATLGRRMKALLDGVGWKGVLAGTRKTTPGFRLVEKYAMLIGGADTHRFDLSSMIMLKDNHIVASGCIAKAVKAARQVGGFSIKIEVECRHAQDAEEAALAGADITMLDNLGPDRLAIDSKLLKEKFPKLLVEASGGITEDTLTSYALPHVDIISCSRLCQGYGSIEMMMKFVPGSTHLVDKTEQ